MKEKKKKELPNDYTFKNCFFFTLRLQELPHQYLHQRASEPVSALA
jgi:hypothetical protein